MLSSGRRRVTRNDQIAISGSLLAGAASFVQRLIAGHGDVAEPLTTLGLLPKLSTLWRGPGQVPCNLAWDASSRRSKLSTSSI